ncbi:hypothetical protein GGX14DRAFT_556091 [Mycena pura]|uniref:Uncharacterized protein n=1 Tax=Mycena pura TaxID=153505 RepID=A0AAD6YNU5_9AGAR|nr:hypothetical protein GGX14DRAFT_556091 [Mycena pura]
MTGRERWSDTICPKCRLAYLTLPKRCTGFHTVANVDRYYQYCSRHNFTANSPCKYFDFNDTIQKLYESGAFGVEDPTLEDDSQFESWLNSSLSAMSSNPPSASSSPSSSPSKRQRIPCANTICKYQGNTSCIQRLCKSCCEKSSRMCSAGPHRQRTVAPQNSFTVARLPSSAIDELDPSFPPTASSNSQPSSSQTMSVAHVLPVAYARPTDPSYAAKVASGDFEMHTPSHLLAAYKKAETHSVEVHWWAKDGSAAEVFMLQAPHFPYFHPKDCSAIATFVGGEAKLQNYSYWAETKWIQTDLAVTIKPRTPVYLRSSNVTVCLDGPTSSPSKRKLSITVINDSPTPRRARLQHGNTKRPRPHITPLVFPANSSPASGVIDLTRASDDNEAIIQTEPDVFTQTRDQLSNGKGFKLAHLKSLLLLNNANIAPQMNRWNVNTAIKQLEKSPILVNWDFIKSSEDDSSKPTEALIRKWLFVENLINLPENHTEIPDDLMGSSPLSSRSPSVSPIQSRPASAMSGIMADASPEILEMSENKDTADAEDTANTAGVNMEGIMLDAGPELLEATGNKDMAAEDTADTAGVNIGGGDAHMTRSLEDIETVQPPHISVWGKVRATEFSFRDPAFWECIARDPEVDHYNGDPKVVIVNFLEPHVVELRRVNWIPDSNFKWELNQPSADEAGNITGTDRKVPASAWTYNAPTRKLIRALLDLYWPGVGDGFLIFWRLPGFLSEEEFGPLAIIHEGGDDPVVEWTVGKDHILPVLGPQKALRVLLVLRRPLAGRRPGASRLEEAADIPLSVSAEDQVKTYVEEDDMGNDSMKGSSEGESHEDGSDNGSAVQDVDTSSEENDSVSESDHPPPYAPPVVPITPATAAATAAADIEEANRLTTVWLERTFANRHFPAVLEMRATSDRASLRVKRPITTSVAWAEQVYAITDAHERVPVLEENGVAGNKIISNLNLGMLFMRQPAWISTALQVHTFIKANRHRGAVATFLQSGAKFGLNTFAKQLCDL